MTTQVDAVLAENLLTLGIAVGAVRASISRELDFTPQQVELLCSLGHGPRSASTLADLLSCDKTNVTGLVDRLERRALVRRERDERDRRVVRVVLTGEGEDVVREFRLRSSEELARSFAAWPQEERDQLSELARRAIDSVNPGLVGLLDN